MCCLLASLMFFGPRFAILLWWVIDTQLWESVYSQFLLPCLGFFFLPYTTLMYVLVARDGSATGFDYFLLIFAFLLDVGAFGGGYQSRRRYINDDDNTFTINM